MSPSTSNLQRLSRRCLFEGPKPRRSRKCLFEEKDGDNSETCSLKKAGTSLLHKNKALRAQLRRLRAKSTPKRGESDKSISLSSFRCEVSKMLAIMQTRRKGDTKKWTKEEKNFCMSLFYKSPSTYVYLRRQGIVLASPTTIRSWLAKSNCLPGLCPEVFAQLNKKIETASLQEKACVVCYDEMSIMKALEYSKKYDLIEGFEDLGGKHRTNKLANYALVFLVRGLYSNWKVPVAYFLSHNSVKAENLQLLVKAVINKLFANGLLPKAVVCDQATTNQKVFKALGITKHSPFFFCNEKKIYAIFDVPHLIKNVRNNLLTSDFVHQGNKISFKDIVKTYEIDKKSNKSRTLTKITDKHINPNSFQKMTVSYATQIFSNSVAAAIKTAKQSGQLNSETAINTADFVKMVNNLFDTLNSKKRFDPNPYRCAISMSSSHARQALVAGKKYFETLQKISTYKLKNGSLKTKESRPPCFDGMVQSCVAIEQLYQEESTEKSNEFLITSKVNQDVIENLFARFRQRGGSNRNPSARVLRTIFKSNVVNSFIKLPSNKNCEDEEDDDFLEACDRTKNTLTETVPEPVRESTLQVETASSNLLDEPSSSKIRKIAATSTSDCNSPYESTTTLEECSITYFAGYLAKSCIQNFHNCDLCNKNLLKNADLDDEKQLLILNKSYDFSSSVILKVPSDDLLELVDLSLNVFNTHFHEILHQPQLKSKLFNAIVGHLSCEVQYQRLLNLSCTEHVHYLINKMILVKIHFYCKSKKNNVLELKQNPKLRIISHK